MFTAWRTAAFIRAPKLPRRPPSIRKPAERATPDRPQSSKEVLSIMRQLVAMTNSPAFAGGMASSPEPSDPSFEAE